MLSVLDMLKPVTQPAPEMCRSRGTSHKKPRLSLGCPARVAGNEHRQILDCEASPEPAEEPTLPYQVAACRDRWMADLRTLACARSTPVKLVGGAIPFPVELTTPEWRVHGGHGMHRLRTAPVGMQAEIMLPAK